MNEIANSMTTDFETYRWLLVAAVGGLVFLLLWGMYRLVVDFANPARLRLKQLKNPDSTGVRPGQRFFDGVIRLGNAFLPSDKKETSEYRKKLSQAGFRTVHAVPLFFAIKIVLMLGLPLLVFIVMPLFLQVQFQYQPLIAGYFLFMGAYAPNFVLSRFLAKRQEQVKRGFADMLDLLVVSVEAGLGFDIALRRVANELKTSHLVLAEELDVVIGEMRAGVERIVALRNLAERTGVSEIKGFVALIAQSLRFGSGIAETLHIYAEDFRDKRMQAAEEHAAKLGVKLIFPLVLCFFPSFFIIGLGPIIIRAVAAF